MSFLPISINIANKQIVIIGGGKVALQKLKSLLLFKAKVRIIAPHILEEIQELEVECISDSYQQHYISDAFMVYACTDQTSVNNQVVEDCNQLNKLCNNAEDSTQSDFISSAIVQSESLTVAINSKAKEPRKTKAFKHQIEEQLNEAEAIAQHNTQKGKVYLVGFGPGNPDLLTVKAKRLLYAADVIFYDDLLDVNALAPFSGEKVYVGKRRGNHSKEQNQINEVLCEAAKANKMVVRLKGGDPLIFGRGTEEKYYLEKHNIEVEIVPGITSAIAAAAYSGVPLTHRGISSTVAFGTAHGKKSFKILEADSSVYYMCVKNLPEIAKQYIEKGYAKDYPVALVHNATMPQQQVIKTTVSELAKGNIDIASPVISIFGKTVHFEQILDQEKTL
ncbi:uroporphyrinogen-III C-methyltransferase [Prolixibacteraceae bacterium JC049]|nr:uroporphyrinogen-III C-methyltransferase [Prolixibacteraceae bacterium JC049]